MTHLWIDEPITVMVDDDGFPTRFDWQGHRHRVKTILKSPWEIDSDWWRADGAIHRLCMLILTDRGMICVIFYDQLERTWRFRRRYD